MTHLENGSSGFLSALFGLGGLVAFWFFRKKKSPVKEEPFQRETAAKEFKESTHETPDTRSPDPELSLWHQKVDQHHPQPVRQGLYPKSLDRIDEKQGKIVEGRLKDLIPPSPSTLQLTRLLRNPQTNAKEIAAMATRDPVLSGRLLRAINSSYFGLSQEVTSVGRAILLLGYNQVKALLFDDLLRRNFTRSRQEERERMDRVWIHSIVVSICAGELGHRLEETSPTDWGTLGLLHDLGKYVLFVLKRIGEPGEGIPPLLQEERRYGINHALLGSLVAKSWSLPDEISKVIAFHHHPAFWEPEAIPADYRAASSVVFLADHLARVLGFTDGQDEVYLLRKDVLDYLRIGPDLKNLVTPSLIREIEKAIAINEKGPASREMEKKEPSPPKGERKKEAFMKIECPRCGYDTLVSSDLFSFGEQMVWVCPGCGNRVVRKPDTLSESGKEG